MADAELCQRIRCGAVSQDEVGPEALYECSAAGYNGVLSCNHPDCAPYHAEMVAAGICAGMEAARVTEVLPIRPAVVPDPGERPGAPVSINPPVADPGWGQGRGMWCQAMGWVDANPCLAVGLVVAGWFVLRGR